MNKFIQRIILVCGQRPWMVLLVFLIMTIFSVRTIQDTSLDALPDLSDPQVIIMSENDFSPAAGSSITNELSDLVIATRGNVLLNDAQLESVREIAIRALAGVELQNVDIRSDSMVRIAAAQDLNVDGLQLSQSLPSLIMEATTIRLSNIDFPAATQVQLNSLKGPIDMKYPNFGTAIPQSQQIGRVNFLDNVKSGGNLIMDRAAFDQFGGNINIGKLP